MSYRIITDSCADLTPQMYRDLNVDMVPLSVTFKGQTHDNLVSDADIRTLYDALREGEMATTAAANPEGWAKAIRPALEAGEDVLVLTFSSAMSTTYQSAVIAAQDLMAEFPERKINVVDTLCAALGQGLLVWHTCKKRDEGLDLEQLTAWVEENKLHICHWVTVDDLDHLKRGGRVSATTAFVGTMLNIKPIIYVNEEGKLISIAKARGRKAAMEHLVKRMSETCEGYDNETVFIAHGDCPEDAQALAEMVKEKCGVKHVHIGYVGAVIGAHTGPGVLVVFFMGQHR